MGWLSLSVVTSSPVVGEGIFGYEYNMGMVDAVDDISLQSSEQSCDLVHINRHVLHVEYQNRKRSAADSANYIGLFQFQIRVCHLCAKFQ